MLLEALQQLELATEVVVVVARREVLVHPLASQLRVERVDEDGWLCAATHRSHRAGCLLQRVTSLRARYIASRGSAPTPFVAVKGW